MPIVTCANCSTRMKAPDNAAGKKVKCPKCATPVPVPASEVEPPEEVDERIASKPAPRRSQQADDREEIQEQPRRRKEEARPRRRHEEDEDDRPADDPGMKTDYLPGELPMKNGAANMQRGIATVGGWLYLTNQRLIFEPHAINFSTENTIVRLTNVTGARKCWTRFLGLIPLAPNSIAVSTSEGKDLRFVTFDRESWIDAIEEQRRAARRRPKATSD